MLQIELETLVRQYEETKDPKWAKKIEIVKSKLGQLK